MFKYFIPWCNKQRQKGVKGIIIYCNHIPEAIGVDNWDYPGWCEFHRPANDNEAKP